MIIVCICGKKKFEVNSDLIPSTGRTIQCGSCDKVWFFNPNKENLYIEEDSEPKISETINIEEKNEIKPKKKINVSNKTKNKKFEVTKYQNKSNISTSKFLSYILVFIISFVALIILIDTFKTFFYEVFPSLEIMLFSLFETLKDIKLFVKDLI